MNGSGEDAVTFLYLLGALVLVLSAFAVRRIPIGQGLKMAVAWLLIFLAVFVGFTLKDDFAALGRRIFAEAGADGQPLQSGRDLRVRQSLDGHFWVTGKVNGKDVRFLVDSGATMTSLSAAAAREAGVETTGGMPVMVSTANGIIEARRGRVERLDLGTIQRRDVAVHVSEAFGPTSVLGMNFLSSLSAWGVEGEWLILKP